MANRLIPGGKTFSFLHEFSRLGFLTKPRVDKSNEQANEENNAEEN
jgi:hypothetical protein